MHSRQRDVSYRPLFGWFFISLLSISSCTPDALDIAESEPVASVVKAEVSDEPSAASTENQDIRLSTDGTDRSRSTSRDLYGSDFASGGSSLYSSNRQGFNPSSQAQLENNRMLPSQSLGHPAVMIGRGLPHLYPNAYPGAAAYPGVGAYPHSAGVYPYQATPGIYPQVSPYQQHLYPGVAGLGGLGALMNGFGLRGAGLQGLGVQPYQYGPQYSPALYGHGSPIASPFLTPGISPIHNHLYPGALDYGYGRLPQAHGGYYPSPYAHHPYVDPYHSYPGHYHPQTPYHGSVPHTLYQSNPHANQHGSHYGSHDGRHTGRGYSPRDSYRGTNGFSNNHETVTPYINQRGGYYPDPSTARNQYNLNTQSTVESPTLAVAPATQQAVNNVPPVSPIPAVQRFPYGYRQRRLRPQKHSQSGGGLNTPKDKNLDDKLNDAKINQAAYSPIINPHLLQPSNRYANQPGIQDNRSIRRTLNRLYNTEQIPYQPPTKPDNADEPKP